jgi:adenylate cyclase, class 2
MQTEIEAKFLKVDHDEMRTKLRALGAELEHPMRLMRRVMLDYPDSRFQKGQPSQRLRIRDEGNKVTVNYKKDNDGNYVHEIETTIGSFDEMYKLLEAIGLKAYSFQESKRETWKFNQVEVVLDEWPWLAPYIEIEGPDEQSIQEVAKDLGLDWSNAAFGSVDTAYMAQYPGMKQSESVGDLAEVKFSMPVPKYFTDRQVR